MNIKIIELTQKMDHNESVLLDSIIAIQEKLKLEFPDDYIEFILRSNGAEGFVGESYLVIWRLDEIVILNESYEVKEKVPGLILFGSDGGGEAYAFDTRSDPIQYVQIPYIGMSFESLKAVGNSFEEFLEWLNSRYAE